METQTKGECTRDQIIEAANRLFVQNGFHGTSMRQIAAQAGLALGGIYNHFASKEDIFLAVLMRYHPVFSLLPELESAQGDTVEEFIRDAAHKLISNVSGRETFLNLMFIELVEFNSLHVPQLFEMFYPRVLSLISRFLQGREELRQIPTPVLIRAFVGLFFSYIITELLIGNNLPAAMQANSLDQFVEIFLHGILKESR